MPHRLALSVRRADRHPPRPNGPPLATDQAARTELHYGRCWISAPKSVFRLDCATWRNSSSGRLGHKCHLLSHDVAERLVGLHGFEPAIELYRGLDTTVPRDAPNGLVVARMMLEIDSRRGVAKLVRGDAQANGVIDTLGDLAAECFCILAAAGLAAEQPKVIRPSQQRRTKIMNIFVDQGRQLVVEWEVEIDAVLHVIMRKHQHVRRVESTRLDQVLIEPDVDEVAQADGGECENGDADRHLGCDSGLDARMLPQGSRLSHQCPGEIVHLGPDVAAQDLADDG